MKNYFDVKGKVAVVTGASSGLGKQFAKCLAEQGCNVAIMARRVAKLEETKAECEALGVKCIAIPCDVSQYDTIKGAVDEVIKEFGKIDILINNAAVGIVDNSLDYTFENWDKMMATNVGGAFFMARECARHMIDKQYGRIINIGSFHCVVTMNKVPRNAYTTSKGAILQMTKALASEWAKYGITVNCLGPGFFESEMQQKVGNPAYFKNIADNNPSGRQGKPGELNGTLLYLASDASTYVNGQLVLVDGGWTIV